jgi:hypothetical protein
MSLLWKTAMAWVDHQKPPPGHPVSVRDAGFAGYTAPHDEEMLGDPDEHDGWDEDLWDKTTPELSKEDWDHYSEHGEYPEGHEEEHDRAYGEAMDARNRESRPDHEDYDLGHFIDEHAHEAENWHTHGTLGHVDLTKPIHATQSHVHTGHMDRYDSNPHDTAWHLQNGGMDNEYLANQHPLFVTHHGRTHVIDGHNRVGAALRRGDKSIKGWHMELTHFRDPECPDCDA